MQNPFDLTLDTASTHHIVDQEEMFIEYKKINKGKVRFGTQDLVAEGIGTIKVCIEQTGKCLLLQDVLHVPGLDRRLLSWRLLDINGYRGQIVVTTDKGENVFSAHLKNDFYVVKVTNLKMAEVSNSTVQQSHSAKGV